MVHSPSPTERLIVALDVSTEKEALTLVDELQDVVQFFKVGMELISSGTGIELMKELVSRNFKVFADFKLFDIPVIVNRAVRNLHDLGITFLTVHGDPIIMKAAVDASDKISILAVTVLTSMDDQSLREIGCQTSTLDLVKLRAISAKHCGCAGVIASAQEARSIRKHVGKDFLIVTPGIRSKLDPSFDQKRTMSIYEAIRNGSDYVVVGRPILKAEKPREVAESYQREIRKALEADKS